MKLIIIESPNKAKTIQKYLGQEYRVLASGGHVCDLPERSLGIDVEHDFSPEYVVNKDKKDAIKRMKEVVAKSDTVYLATDPDREGEAISWHLANVLGLDKDCNRIEFNEISQKAVKHALDNPRRINMQLVDAQQARRVLDRLVGYKVSPILNKKIKSGLSGGRVQSAALKMLVDREREIRDFVPEEYWNIFAFLTKQNDEKNVFKAQFVDAELKKVKVDCQATAEKVVSLLRTAAYSVDKVQRGVSKTRPQPPFTTSTLQQDGSHKLGLTAPQVMQVAQQLYEGIELADEGHVALVTYIRTDSVRISPESQQEALQYVISQYGKDFAPSKPNFYTTKAANVQDAHEAIRPISLLRTPDSIKDKVNRNQYKLYKLIYNRFLASQMTEAVYNTLNVHITADTENGRKFGLKVSGRTQIFKGFTAVYDIIDEAEDKDESSESRLPNFCEGEILNLNDIKSEQKFTKPPSRYTDATLVKAMEENGIGRPSTYASVIAVLAKREYTVKEQKAIKPTNLGETVTDFMTEFFANIVDVQFTANMENELDTVEKGGVRWQDIIAGFYPAFDKLCREALFNNKKMRVKEELSDIICEKCGAPMVLREGRFGKFYGCSNYPKCKNIKNVEEEVVSTCPDCGGNISKKHSKSGKVFYGCSNYPKCTFMSWEPPAPYYCPKCGKLMRVVKKDDKTEYICINKACNNVILANETKD